MYKNICPMPPVAEVEKKLRYDPCSGLLYRRLDANGKEKIAGHKNKKGYIEVGLGYEAYSAHRLAWLLFYKTDPACPIDHINRNPSDNRIQNLRLTDPRQNGQNRGREAEAIGTIRATGCKKFCAQIRIGDHNFYLGIYATRKEASAAYWGAFRLLEKMEKNSYGK